MVKGLLLVNLGTPDTFATSDVRAYLNEFLSDPNVIKMPKWLWQPILHRFILPTRSWHSAALYERIWDRGESPLRKYTRLQAEQVQAQLPDWIVKYAMTYRMPRVIDELHALKAAGADKIVVLPLFPQYSATTTKTIEEQVAASGVEAQVIKNFYAHPKYLDLLAKNIAARWQTKQYDKLLLSYHGLPTSYIRQGDPYLEQVNATTTGIMSRMPDLNADNTMQVFQSKFGPMPWLKPYLKATLAQLPMHNERRVLVALPAFVADCIETLEEIQVENHDEFLAMGGELFDVVQPFNDSLAFTDLLVTLARDTLN
ncbi:ferrochelatase [Weissella diestrammenae]|uniref:Coproporphyrin III ferrochelatase n=1 Tax=Weissella diestrammenae TaxID=1162633 RepID=A0A7G9T3G4_9LACO|nr:ferrochelatase [Weissella diestrammenae]MCM0582096.1 ferrochelatase [Weissella diestrammenae]QNN74639.1 ferrochelatase [Weissella diestrammenae]